MEITVEKKLHLFANESGFPIDVKRGSILAHIAIADRAAMLHSCAAYCLRMRCSALNLAPLVIHVEYFRCDNGCCEDVILYSIKKDPY